MNLEMFYRDYAAWLDAGAPEHQPFSRSEGLCYSLIVWCYHKNTGESGKTVLLMALSMSFHQAGLLRGTPFNEGITEFSLEAQGKACHLNPKRIAWVREHAK